MGDYASRADLQQSAAMWLWGEALKNAIDASEVLNTPEWSEFDVTTPDGTRATVRIEVQEHRKGK